VFLFLSSITIYILDTKELWNRINSFKVGSSGIEIILEDAKNKIIEEEKKGQTDEVKKEIKSIKNTSLNKIEVINNIRENISIKISIIADAFGIKYSEYTGVRIVDLKNILDDSTISLILDYYKISNKISHSKKYYEALYDDIIAIGEIILSRLNLVHYKDVKMDDAIKTINELELEYPSLSLHRGLPKSGEIRDIGIYFAVRDQQRKIK